MKDIWLEKKTGRWGEKIKTINGGLSLQTFSHFFLIVLWAFFFFFGTISQQKSRGFSQIRVIYFPQLFLLSGRRKEHSYSLKQKAPVTLPSLERFTVTPSNLCMRELCSNWHCSSKAWWQEVQTWSFLFNPKPSVNPADSTEVQNYIQVSLLRVKI